MPVIDERTGMTRSRPGPDARVIFVNRFFFPDESATSQLLSDLSFGLARRGFEIHVVCSRQRYDDASAALAPIQTENGVVIHRVWSTRFGRDRLVGRAVDYATFYCSSALRLIGMLRARDVVVAETDPPLISIVAMSAAWLKRAVLVNWLQDVFPEIASHLGANPLPGWMDQALRALRDASLRAAEMNVVLGERMRELLEQRGITRERLCIIENWAPADCGSPPAVEESRLRARLGLGGRFVLGYSGNLGRAHEFNTLLDAATALRTEDGIRFLMIGGGAGMSQLKRAVAERGLENLLFLPYQPRSELTDSMAAADVHLVSLLPALEGLIVPSKFFGVLAAARPVIFVGDPDGELGRVIRSSHSGVVIRIGDSENLISEIRAFAADPNRCSAMGKSGRQRYEAAYSPQRALDRWDDLLQPLIR
jgi:glycosyltransferase involved in cell wall biosynthesis